MSLDSHDGYDYDCDSLVTAANVVNDDVMGDRLHVDKSGITRG